MTGRKEPSSQHFCSKIFFEAIECVVKVSLALMLALIVMFFLVAA